MAMNFPPPGPGKDSKKKMLGKMKMPGDGDPGLGIGDEGSPEEEASEFPEEEGKEDEAGGQDLAGISDEDLMAEIKKRGLTAELEHGDHSTPPPADDQEAGY